MKFIRQLNKMINKISFKKSRKIYFLHEWKIKTYAQDTLDGEDLSIRCRNYTYLPRAVRPNSPAAVSLDEFLELDKRTKTDKIKTVLDFYHSLPYTLDEKFDDGDDAKTVYGGLITGKLDCEDFSIGITTMLRRHGMSAHLVFIERPNPSETSHAVACLSEDDLDNPKGEYVLRMGKRYFLIEGTSPNKVGEMNSKYRTWKKYFIDCSGVTE